MSIPVDLDRLSAEMERFGAAAYVLSGAADGRPHIAHVAVSHDGAKLRARVGRRGASNMGDRPLVSVLWPPFELGGYSLIVDATALLDGDEVELTPTGAVLHRPAGPTATTVNVPVAEGTCASDCVPLD